MPINAPSLQRIAKVVALLLCGASAIGFAQKLGLVQLVDLNTPAPAAAVSIDGSSVAPQVPFNPIPVPGAQEQLRREQFIIENCTDLSFNYPVEAMNAFKRRCILDESK